MIPRILIFATINLYLISQLIKVSKEKFLINFLFIYYFIYYHLLLVFILLSFYTIAAFYQWTYQNDSKDFNICNYKSISAFAILSEI